MAVFWAKGSSDFRASEIFTTLSIVILVSQPISNLVESYTVCISGLACWGRIQSFLLLREKADHRDFFRKLGTRLPSPNDKYMRSSEPGIELSQDEPTKTPVGNSEPLVAANEREVVSDELALDIATASPSESVLEPVFDTAPESLPIPTPDVTSNENGAYQKRLRGAQRGHIKGKWRQIGSTIASSDGI